jgi:hypothetical protein
MDVDLASSSRDVMTILDRLPRQSCVFSHECGENNFQQGAVVSQGGPDDVIQPIVEAFSQSGRNITGKYLFGNTGAFWESGAALSILSTDAVLRLIRVT